MENIIYPPDKARAEQYKGMAAIPNKLLQPDGSVTTGGGAVILPPDPARAEQYRGKAARADKLLQPDGAVTASEGFGETGGGHTILDGEGNALPQQPALQFTGNVAVMDGEGVTSVEVGSKQPGQIIGVWGTLERRALAANTWTKIKFIPTGGYMENINETGEWVCPADGVYDLYSNFGQLNVFGDSFTTFTLNSSNSASDFNKRIGTGSASGASNSPILPCKAKLTKGDNISLWILSTVAQTKQTYASNFIITLDTSINITVWDAYETWKSLDPENANVSYDEWMFGGIRNFAYDIWQAQNTGTEQDFLKWLRVGGFSPTNIGEIFWWPLSAPPTDSLYCDGRAIDRAEYADLFRVIGTTFGAGDGETTFNLPDLRGEFIRGYDPEAVRDPDGATRMFGEHQDDALQNITGGLPQGASRATIGHPSITMGERNGAISISSATAAYSALSGGSSWKYFFWDFDASRVARTSTETRPTNINLLPCIRYTASFTTAELSKLKNFLATLPE